MDFMDFFKERIRDFFMITTLVNICMYILGTIYYTDMTCQYNILLMPIVYGFVGTLPSWIHYSKHELSIKDLMVRKIIAFIVLEISMLMIEMKDPAFSFQNTSLVISFALSVFIIYLLVEGITWFIDRRSANQLMEDLQSYQDHYLK